MSPLYIGNSLCCDTAYRKRERPPDAPFRSLKVAELYWTVMVPTIPWPW